MTGDSILYSTMYHRRILPLKYEFRYKLIYLKLDIDNLNKSANQYKLLKYNKKSVFSIYDTDYLSAFNGSLKEKIEKLLLELGIKQEITRVELVTHPRFLGFVFNPVSFFLCYRQDDLPDVLISEVHNTFGEAHVYVTEKIGRNEKDHVGSSSVEQVATYKANKSFHVSPFFSRQGEYEFKIVKGNSKLTILINLLQNEKVVFESGVVSKLFQLNNKSIFAALTTLPFSILLTMPRIIWHAAILKYRKGLKVFTKPIAADKMTFRVKQASYFDKLLVAQFKKFLSLAKYGQMNLIYPSGLEEEYSGEKTGIAAKIKVLNYDFFRSTILHGDIGFGEAYVDGYWDSDNLVDVLRFFSQNLNDADDRKVVASYYGRFKNAVGHYTKKNSLRRTKKNISAHYDLSNELFNTFLDTRMQYSSALFTHENESLESAQLNKIIEIGKLARLEPDHHLLEIGCGWGGLALELVKRTGCSYTGVTLSKEQKDYFDNKIKENNLESKMKVLFTDYRNIKGSFDRIISVEMIEAVGHKYLPSFFKTCNSLLKQNGVLVMQGITIPEVRYKAYRLGCDWIQKYIFPGGFCPSVHSLVTAAQTASFTLENTNNIAQSYARTLEAWREQFNLKQDKILSLGFDERFVRIWNYYLSYCEAGFRERMVNVHQMTFSRQGNGETLNANI